MTVSKAQVKAQNKWIDKTYDRINLTVAKGQKEVIKAHADALGESVNAFINRAIAETIERDLLENIKENEETGGDLFELPPSETLLD